MKRARLNTSATTTPATTVTAPWELEPTKPATIVEEIASVPSSASMPRPRSRVETQLGRCLKGTFQIRLNALWEAFMIPSPASSANASPIASAGALPLREWNLS